MTLYTTREFTDALDRDPVSRCRPLAVARCLICQTLSRVGNWCGVCGRLEAAGVFLGDPNNEMGVDPDD